MPVAYQDALSPPMTPELAAACARAMHVLTAGGELLRAGRAATFVLERIGYRRTARLMASAPAVPLVELGYWLVARSRHWVGRPFLNDLRPQVEPTREAGRVAMQRLAAARQPA